MSNDRQQRLKAAKRRFSDAASKCMRGDPQAARQADLAWLECKRILDEMKAEEKKESET